MHGSRVKLNSQTPDMEILKEDGTPITLYNLLDRA